MNRLVAILLSVILLLGIYIFQKVKSFGETKREVDTSVLLEKVKSVTKLITVEGYFSEIYENKEYLGYDFSPLRKKALIRVKAKVSVGYDMTAVKFESIPEQKIIKISLLPNPEILSIDHDLDYYDITEGSFNSFDESDFNKMNAEAKKKIEQVAKDSDLFEQAEKQSDQIFEMIKMMVENAGWQIEIEKPVKNPEFDKVFE